VLDERAAGSGRTGFPGGARVALPGGLGLVGCGDASSAVGPFYCPADRQVYLDQLGTSAEVRRLEGEQPGDANDLSVRLELQAD
jgi:uncharacterized protein